MKHNQNTIEIITYIWRNIKYFKRHTLRKQHCKHQLRLKFPNKSTFNYIHRTSSSQKQAVTLRHVLTLLYWSDCKGFWKSGAVSKVDKIKVPSASNYFTIYQISEFLPPAFFTFRCVCMPVTKQASPWSKSVKQLWRHTGHFASRSVAIVYIKLLDQHGSATGLEG